ncbi:MAG: hypothetical protein ACRD4B_01060 [Acidobacteriota bacterium]
MLLHREFVIDVARASPPAGHDLQLLPSPAGDLAGKSGTEKRFAQRAGRPRYVFESALKKEFLATDKTQMNRVLKFLSL